MENIKEEYLKLLLKKHLNIDVCSLLFLPRGVTNKNYLVNNHLVVKLKDFALGELNDIQNEQVIATLLHQHGLTPKHHFYPELITIDYLDNVSYLGLDNYALYVPKLVDKIKKLHDIDASGIKEFSMFKRLEFYISQTTHKEILPNLDLIVDKTLVYFEKSKKTLCHNDLVNGNILINNHDIHLIDFEYSGVNDPDFDVVSFLSENDFVNDDVRALFLSLYYGQSVPTQKLEIYELFSDALWHYWALYCYEKTKRAIFIEIALAKKDHYIRTMAY